MGRSDTDSDDARSRTRYKTGKVIEKYGLEELDAELVERWTGDGEDAASLRQLASEVNHRLLRVAMQDAGMDLLDGEVENIYRLLTDDVSGGDRVHAERRLERNGIDVAALRDDFVTHQAVYTYLTKHHGARKDGDDDGPTQVEKDVQSLNQLRNRLRLVTENTLDRLNDTGRIEIAEPSILVDAQVTCQECGDTYDIADLEQVTACSCRQ